MPNDVDTTLDQLKRSTTALALPAERQIELWVLPGPLPEEMAVDFEASWHSECASRDSLNQQQATALDLLDSALAALSTPANTDKRFDNQWVLSPEWNQTRQAAAAVCRISGWSLDSDPWDDVRLYSASQSSTVS